MQLIGRHGNWDLYSCDDHYHIKLSQKVMRPTDMPMHIREYDPLSEYARRKEGSLVLVNGEHEDNPYPFEIVLEYYGDYCSLRRLKDDKNSFLCDAWFQINGIGRHERFFREDTKMYHRATFAEVTPNYIEQLKSGSTGAMKAGPSEAKKSGSTTVDVPAGWESYGNFDASQPYPNDFSTLQPQMPVATSYNNYDSSSNSRQPVASPAVEDRSGGYASSSRQPERKSKGPSYRAIKPASDSKLKTSRSHPYYHHHHLRK